MKGGSLLNTTYVCCVQIYMAIRQKLRLSAEGARANHVLRSVFVIVVAT